MTPSALTPILNVSNLQDSFNWFNTFGWQRGFEWGDPPGFGSVFAGDVQIFLCEDGQGGRGHGGVASTFGPDGSETADKGCWLSVWVDDVSAVHAHCVEHGIEVTFEPTDMPWGVCECHVRHPDGHVFRLSQSINS